MKRWGSILFVLCCVVPPAAWGQVSASAGKIGSVTVTNSGYHGNGPWVIVTVAGASAAAKAPCATLTGYAFDVTSPSGPALLSALLSAKERRGTVRFVGSGSCDDVAPGLETLSYIVF